MTLTGLMCPDPYANSSSGLVSALMEKTVQKTKKKPIV
jgi:hypothetical protein